jgi:hypothetical protein
VAEQLGLTSIPVVLCSFDDEPVAGFTKQRELRSPVEVLGAFGAWNIAVFEVSHERIDAHGVEPGATS